MTTVMASSAVQPTPNYQELNKEFDNDDVDKRAMVISVFNLEN